MRREAKFNLCVVSKRQLKALIKLTCNEYLKAFHLSNL